MKCKICHSESVHFDEAKVLNKYPVKYYQCHHCGFVQTDEPFWLDEAYSDAILDADIGLLGRNYNFSRVVSALLKVCFSDAETYLDYGGGRGIFVRLMRDMGFSFEWYDKYCQNIFSPQFLKSKDHYDVITAFELFEHLPNPLQDIEILLKLGATVIFSTELLPEMAPRIQSWWYFDPEDGQHISFFTEKSLKLVAKKFHCSYSHYGSLHVLGQTRIPWWKLKLCCRFPDVVNRFLKRESLLAADYEYITGKVLK